MYETLLVVVYTAEKKKKKNGQVRALYLQHGVGADHTETADPPLGSLFSLK